MIDSGDSSRPGGRSSSTGEARASTPTFHHHTEERSSSPNQNNNYPSRKQVVLPTVKRDYEKNGAPRGATPHDCNWSGYTSHMTDQPGEECYSPDRISRRIQGSGDDPPSGISSAPNLDVEMARLRLEERRKEEKPREPVPAGVDESRDHGIASSCSSQDDSCLISYTPSLEPSQKSLPSASTSNDSIQAQPPSSGDGRGQDGSSSSSDEGEEEAKAPFELMGEFLEAVMDEDFEAADKLCKMILLYEPDNAECKQFQPLIEEMLKRERKLELLGSSSDDDDDDDDDDSEEDTEDEDDGDDSGESEESQEDSSNDDDDDDGDDDEDIADQR